MNTNIYLRFGIKGLAWALMMTAGLLINFDVARADTVEVPANRSEIITVPVDLSEVIIANPEIADVYVHGKRRVSIIGKSIGHTTIRLFDEDSNLVRSASVHVTYDLPAVRKALKEFLPYERIGVKMINTRIALTGAVSSAQVASTALEIAEQFLPAAQQATSGDGADDEGIDLAPERALGVVNLMSISSGQQVMLRIRIGEIQRSALKNLGVNLQAISGSDKISFFTGGGSGVAGVFDDAVNFGSYAVDSSSTRGAFGLSYITGNGNGISGMIDALETDGLFKTLAEPNLVSMSGERAEFLAGGEFPIPVPQDGTSVTIEFKPFGVSVGFTPFVLSENRIRVNVEPEVSETSTNNQITVGDFIIPSIVTRRASTTIEMAPGESFMIAGLIQDTMRTTIDQVPGLSEIPILSSLFRSTNYQRSETELVLSVTPYIVDPVSGSEITLPTDDFRPASFLDNMLYGALGARGHQGDGKSYRTDGLAMGLEGPAGFMVD